MKTDHLRAAGVEALRNFDGTVMMVSHDRHFLRELTSRVFEVDRGALTVYDGKYSEYEERKAKA